MKSTTLFASILLSLSIANGLYAEQMEVSFFKGTVEAAREKAKKESKLYFIEFHAKWCEPCKWMDEYTFKNTALSSFVDKNFVPVKVDVENMDGFVWKQKYKVQYLPTIIVLNGNGTLLGKYEKSLAASDLLRILQNHRAAPMEVESFATATTARPGTNDVPVKTTNPEAKPAFVTVSREPGLPKATEVQTKKPIVSPEATIVRSTNSLSINNQNIKPMKATSSVSARAPRIDPVKDLQSPYRVQIGVYSDAINMMSEVNKLRKAFTQSVQVFNLKNKATNAVTYRITIGKYSTREDALSFSQELKTKGIQGVVKHISELEQKS